MADFSTQQGQSTVKDNIFVEKAKLVRKCKYAFFQFILIILNQHQRARSMNFEKIHHLSKILVS